MALAKLARRRNDLVHGHLHLVRAIAWRVWRELDATIDFEDLVGHGMVGLVQAARRYDGTRGVTFATFAFYRIRGAMLDAARVLGRFTRREVAAYRAGAPAVDVEAPTPSVDSLPAGAPGADDLSAERDRRRLLRAAVARLPRQERHFIEKIYYEDKRLGVAGAELGLSKSWASRLHDRALGELRKRLADLVDDE